MSRINVIHIFNRYQHDTLICSGIASFGGCAYTKLEMWGESQSSCKL